MMKVAECLVLMLLILATDVVKSQQQVEKIEISTLPGLQFDKVQFAVKPGDQVELTFTNNDDMSHNLLIVQPGRRNSVVEAAMELAEKGPELGYIPPSRDVLWHIPVISPGEKKSITFTAPSRQGAYPFVCTYPGHGLLMYGVMHVAADLKMPRLEEDPDVPDVRKQANQAAHRGHNHEPRLHPYELKPPYFYRAFMEGSGLASIAVRLAHQLAFCWDADACKLQYAWHGGFLDNTDFWHGHKNAYPQLLGQVFYRDKTSHPLRIGNANLSPSVTFKGYRVVDDYPEFMYSVNGLEVYELIREKADGSGLERRFKIPNGLEPVWFLFEEGDGMNYHFSSGQVTAGVVKFSPDEATDFVITMTKTGK